MPGGDGTGPMGMGPMTGRGAGFCAGFQVPGYMNPTGGWGIGSGRGRGFRRKYYLTGMPGWVRYGYPAYPVHPVYNAQYQSQSPAYDREFLANQAEFLENQLKQIKKQLKQFDKETKEDGIGEEETEEEEIEEDAIEEEETEE